MTSLFYSAKLAKVPEADVLNLEDVGHLYL